MSKRRTTPTEKRSSWLAEATPVRVFGWFLGAISAINLFNDLDLVELKAQFFGWMEVYQRLVERVGEFVFGWLNFWFLGVSSSEAHGLVLSALILRALASSVRPDAEEPENVTTLWGTPFLALYLLLVLMTILLVDPVGVVLLAASLAILPVLIFPTVVNTVRLEGASISGRDFIANLATTAMIAAAIIVTDYVWQQL